MEKTASRAKTFAMTMCAVLLIAFCALSFAACGSKSLYTINFGGNIEGESYNVAATTWEKSSEEGFEAVYTLKGTVEYDAETAEAMGYTDGRTHFALIRFTSDSVDRVAYDSTTEEGFYCIINKGTANEKVKHASFSSGDGANNSNTYYFYQGLDETDRTLTLSISFDGTEENERTYKFVINPDNYTLADAPAAA